MSGLEYIGIWAVALTFTAVCVGWAFLVQTFGLPDGAAVVLGAGVPLAVIAGALWVVVRRAA
jgi:uncharacterized membrane-anchored protein